MSSIRLAKRALRLVWQLLCSGRLPRQVLLSKGLQKLGVRINTNLQGISIGSLPKEQIEIARSVSEAVDWSSRNISRISADELANRKLRGDAAFREGRYEDFYAEFRAIEEVRQQIRAEAPTSISNLSILMSDWTSPFGNIGLIDQFIKHSQLRTPNSLDVIVTSLESSANPSLVRLFGKACPALFLPKSEVSRLESALVLFREPLEVRTSSAGCLDQYKWMEVADVEWSIARRGPILDLSLDIEERGRRFLKNWGIHEGDWFVTIHVRDESTPGRNACNASIESYVPAIKEILSQGGTVVRIGSSDSTPLPKMRGLIDYARSIRKTSWLDVFLMARCRFFVGTYAGPLGIPQIFGVPTLCTNSPHIALSMSMPRSLVIPKSLVDRKSGRMLGLMETMSRPAAWTFADECLGSVERIDNTSWDITGGVREMIEMIESGRQLVGTRSQLAQNIRKRANGRGTIPISESFLNSALQANSAFLDL